MNDFREDFVPKLPPGVRVRYDAGKYETRGTLNGVPRWYLVAGWMGQAGAESVYGTTVSDLEAQHGADWVALGSGAWAVPDYATGVVWDTPNALRGWVRTSLLTPVGFAQADAGQRELFAA